MKALTILGCPASNRSSLGLSDAETLARRIAQELRVDDFSIFDSLSDSIPRARDLTELISRDLECKELSNSELAMVAALVAARAQGVEVDVAPLKAMLDDPVAGIEMLRSKLAAADGILLASPVYFGDRSSVVQRFVETLYHNPDLAELLRGKAFTGVSVGAKRNGGQETLLIYQLLDFLNFGVVGVGNDSRSTAQYGGTYTAGDKGTALMDEYGVLTSMGAGRRVARIANLRRLARRNRLQDKLRLGVFVLQDRDGQGKARVEALLRSVADEVEPIVFDVFQEEVTPCLGCKLCPAYYGRDQEYACFVQDKGDFFVRRHADIVRLDALMPVAFSPRDKVGLASNYQTFVERTRYIRRSDYLYSNRMLMPLIFEEVGGGQNLHIRMVTSLIRQETIVLKPLVATMHGGRILEEEAVRRDFGAFVREARDLTAGRLALSTQESEMSRYNPVGYALKYPRDLAATVQDKRKEVSLSRLEFLRDEFRQRVVKREQG